MEQEPEKSVSRRQALKRMAAVGGAVWVAPALQTINMARANAGTPRTTCFSVIITAGNKCEEPGPTGEGFHCIVPVTTPGGCGHVTAVSTPTNDPPKPWVINLGSCTFLEGQVKSGRGSGNCCAISVSPGTSGVITVQPCSSGPHGQPQVISGVELTVCCPSP